MDKEEEISSLYSTCGSCDAGVNIMHAEDATKKSASLLLNMSSIK